MIHRATRYDTANSLPWELQFATIFAPRDRFFLGIMEEIKRGQAPFVIDPKEGLPGPDGPKQKTWAKGSDMTDRSAHTFDEAPIEATTHLTVTNAMKLAEIFGAISTTAARKFFAAMSSGHTPPPEQDFSTDDLQTPSKREKDLRDKIVAAQREGYQADPETQSRIVRRGRAIWSMFHKRLEEMTEDELKAVWEHRSGWMVS
jgi:hypothetical protein